MSTDAASQLDPRALKILNDVHWTSEGWRQDRTPASAPDFEHAKRAGIMFDDVTLSHSDIVHRARTAVASVDRRTVANAFVTSLSSRRLDLRSALGSFAVLQHLPEHDATPKRGNCSIGGDPTREPEPHDLNVLNFERFKWGGVRHDNPLYAGFDLTQFARHRITEPTSADVSVLKALLKSIDDSPTTTSAATLHREFTKVLKSTKQERDQIVAILGLCGILRTKAHPGFMSNFVPYSARQLPSRRFVDMAYPACWWTRGDGISSEAVRYWFGHLL